MGQIEGIWHARRKVINEKVFQSLLATYQFIERFLHELGTSQEVNKKESRSGPTVQMPN
jgi:hypothetical protein